MTVFVFSGPTISPDEILRCLPGSSPRPPIQDGDLYSLNLSSQDTVVIIDGYFFKNVCIRHQEIIDALRSGGRVVGTSAMGALRAAELETLGMQGFGTVFRLYNSQILNSDDEVFVNFQDSKEGYILLSETLINIRATLRNMHRAGVIETKLRRDLLALAKKRPFYSRSIESIVEDAKLSGMLIDDDGEVILAGYATHFHDLIKQDAMETLRQLEDSPTAPLIPELPSPTTFSVEWQQRAWQGSGTISRDQMFASAQAMSTDFPEFYLRSNIALMSALYRGYSFERGADLRTASCYIGALLEIDAESKLQLLPIHRLEASEWATKNLDFLHMVRSEDSPSSNEKFLQLASSNLHFRPGIQWKMLMLQFIVHEPGAVAAMNRHSEALALNRRIRDLNSNWLLTRLSNKHMLSWFRKQRGYEVDSLKGRGYLSEVDFGNRFRLYYPLIRLHPDSSFRLGSDTSQIVDSNFLDLNE